MALGSHKDKGLSKADIILKAQELDDRRQVQIKNQSALIDRLLTEHQMMEGLVGELAAEQGNLIGYRDKAKEVLSNIEKLRADARKAKEKQDGK